MLMEYQIEKAYELQSADDVKVIMSKRAEAVRLLKIQRQQIAI